MKPNRNERTSKSDSEGQSFIYNRKFVLPQLTQILQESAIHTARLDNGSRFVFITVDRWNQGETWIILELM